MRLSSVLWPAMVPLVGAVFLSASEDAIPLSEAQWQFIPMLIFGGVALLALRFGRSRLFFAVLSVVITLYFLPRNFEDMSLCLMLLSCQFFVLALVKDGGFKSWQAAVAMVGLVLLSTVVDWPRSLRDPVELGLALGSKTPWSLDLPVQPLTMTAVVAVCVFILTQAIRKGLPFYAGLLGALMATFGAVTTLGFVGECFLLASALCLLFSAIEMSHDLAFRDALTGLPGRRALEEHFKRLARPYTLAMVDVDHFKRFNDTYGHDAGDEALRMVGAELSRIAQGGRAFRYGGEEFTILFTGKTAAEVQESIESVRKRIAERPFAIRDEDRPQKKPRKVKQKTRRVPVTTVTVSIGVADAVDQPQKPRATLKEADQRLYAAKKSGRNRVVISA